MNRNFLCLLLLVCLVPSPATSQKHAPPGIRQEEQYEASHPLEPPLASASPRVNPAELQRQADELASLAQSLPSEVNQFTKGTLPKDIVVKLKQIEKLSKSLRSKLAN